jgi:putative FmdB family regulatory protein
MPIYEYKCENGHVFDVMQRMSDDPLTTCQVCDAGARRVLSAPAIHFKGSGFYNTDYGTRRRAREKEAASENGSKAASSSDSSSSSSDSKPKAESTAASSSTTSSD